MARVIKPILDRVARDAGETAHSALLVGDSLHSVLSTEPDRVTRIRIDHERVPLHATASGTAYLAYSAPEIVERVIEGGLEAFTTNTASTGQELKARLAAIVERGYSLSLGSLEKEVVSVGAPLFGALGTPVGTISIACVASRWQPEREKPLARLVTAAALEIAGGIGGEPRRDFVEAARRLMVEEGRR